MSSMAAIKIAARLGLRTVSRQGIYAVPRASAMIRPAACMSRSFTMSTRLLNKASLTAADSQLAGILNTEIKLEADTDEPAPEIISDFLKTSGFNIVEKEGVDEVELIKKDGGETIHVFFSVSDITNDSAESFFENAEGQEGEVPEDVEGDMPPIRANIVVEKASGALGVECVVQNNVLLIESITPYASGELALSNSAEADYKRREVYQGPPFTNLDENVQSSFEQYLETRGIDTDLADFIIEYSSHRENKEYVNWLKKFKTFVEA